MDNLSSSIESGVNKLMELGKSIPGFSGYLEREGRRDADSAQREFMARRVQALKSEMQVVQQDLLSAGNLSIMEPFDRVSNKLDRFIDRIRHASRGYAAFFDAVKVNEAELDRIYDFDLSMINSISSAEEALTAVQGAAESEQDVKAPLKSLLSTVTEMDNAFNERDNILRGIS